MHVYYRLTSIPSTNPSPIHQEDKNKLNELCLRSFVEAYKDVKPNVTFLCDYCPPVYHTMIETLCPFQKDIQFSELGINGTAYRQFVLAQNVEDEVILFNECDYIYRPNIGKIMEEAIRELDLVSPYDHPNFYKDHDMHSEQVLLKLVNDTHWRSTERDTLTFGIKTSVFKDHADIFKRYGYLDNENWKEMREAGHMLFVPIPSLATHMCSDWMAPSVNWKELYEPKSQ